MKKFSMLMMMTAAALMLCLSACGETPPVKQQPPAKAEQKPADKDDKKGFAVAERKTDEKQPPKEPILRIETGMHTAAIKRIGVDAQERILVTGSDDKTVRVWDIATGELKKILRVPIADGHEGKIYAVAVSPDGKIIAAGGWTGYDFDKKCYIYLFDTDTGAIISRITGLPNVIYHLAFSKDGKYLAAALGDNGLRIYETQNKSLVYQDTEYEGGSYWADFDISGRLVTTSEDSFIRLYDKPFRLIAKQESTGGNEPFSVRFSPDGQKIAVGFVDSTKVDVLSAKDLSYLYSPDTSDVNNGNLGRVTWSYDGRFLFAGGIYQISNNNYEKLIRKWMQEGKGSYTDLSVSDNNTIMHILPLKNNRIVFGGSGPAFGIIDSEGRKRLFKGASIADYRNNLEGFMISADGNTVRFCYEVSEKRPAKFSVSSRTLSESEEKSELVSPITQGLEISDWENNDSPKLNGNAIKLEQYEISRSLAIAPDKKSFLLGAAWSLRLFDSAGNQKWEIPAPGEACGVNISGDGKKAVAAFSDGTIRWYRMTDGKELLALFPHKDGKRWVLWTPSGYYAASPGGDELVGWHFNKGKDKAAELLPFSHYRATHYRPDITEKILLTSDEEEAIRLANQEAGKK